MDQKLLLLRYDTEATPSVEGPMEGFLEKVVQVHRRHEIPATLFCTGRALEAREAEFRAFRSETEGDPLFDVQDHSYSHIGIGYERGRPLEELRADYERSFAAHERILGRRPVGVSICGTGGADGPMLRGFDATEKSAAELEMLASLGVRMVNSFLGGVDHSREFISYACLGHPEMMGFPSGFSDTGWMAGQPYGSAMEYILGVLQERSEAGEHMPLMLHDHVAWLHAPDRELTHVVRIVDRARELGFQPVTHHWCLETTRLWQREPAPPAPQE